MRRDMTTFEKRGPMPRQPRLNSESGFYHVTTRGVDKSIIFKDDADRIRFLKRLRESSEKHAVEIHAWCLMDNHVHLLLRCSSANSLASFMRDMISKYAEYFNNRHDRVGALVQGRFWSAPIKSDEQLLSTVRYIHRNPEEAGMCPADAYRWSSYQSYIRQQGSTNTAMVLAMLGTVDEFIRFHQRETAVDRTLLESEGPLSEEALRDLANEVLGEVAIKELYDMESHRRDPLIRRLAGIGLTLSEISRLTQLTYGNVYRIVKRA